MTNSVSGQSLSGPYGKSWDQVWLCRKQSFYLPWRIQAIPANHHLANSPGWSDLTFSNFRHLTHSLILGLPDGVRSSVLLLGHLTHEGLRALGHFLGRHIFNMSSQSPFVSEWIGQSPKAVSPKHV